VLDSIATPARLRTIYIWLVALAAACLFVGVYTSTSEAYLTKGNYAGLFNNRNAGASSAYTMATALGYSGQTSNAANGDDVAKLIFDWPSGLIGNPTQIPEASRCDRGNNPSGGTQGVDYGACPASAVIGTIEVDARAHLSNFLAQIAGCGDISITMVGKMNLLANYPKNQNPTTPEVPTHIGLSISGTPPGALCALAGAQTMSMTAQINVRPEDQGLRIKMLDPLPRDMDTGTFGTAQIRVDAIRQTANATTPAGKPFMRNPTRCLANTGVPEVDRWRSIVYVRTYDSQNSAGNLPPGASLVTIDGDTYTKIVNVADTTPQCGGQSQDKPAFNPQITLENKNPQAGAPTGIKATITANSELLDPAKIQPSHIKKVSMVMPKDFRINPAIAERLQDPGNPATKSGCTEAQFNRATPSEDPTGAGKCPGWSQIGTLAVTVPELSTDLTGRLFLGQPQTGDMDAPTPGDPNRRSIFRLYMWATRGGVAVKMEGRARVNQTVGDPNYGQIAIEFGDPSYSSTLAPGISQFDFTKFILDFDSGSTGVGSPSSGAIWGADADRQMLMNPQECGSYSMDTVFTPWTSPTQGNAVRPSTLNVTAGNNGSCSYRTFAQDIVTNPFAVEDDTGAVSTTGLGFGVQLTNDYDATVVPSNPNSLKNATGITGVGRHPTMTFKVTRPDRMDNIRQMRFVMPEGFGGSIKATSNSCSVATLNSIAAGTGGNCPSDAKVGDVSVDTGAGPANKLLRIYGSSANGGGIFIMDRHDYASNPGAATGIDASMAGVNELTKYTAKLAIVTPAVVGPFNLGAVVNKLYMRLASSSKFQLSAETGGSGLDQSIRGIPVLYRALTIKMQGVNTQGTVTTADDRPFLILPSKCGTSLAFTGTITSAGSAPSGGPVTTSVTATPRQSAVTTGCSAQTFNPGVEVTNFATAYATPSGMSMKVTVPQTETGVNYNTVQPSTINRMRVQFPPGVEMNPAVAETLVACPTSAIDADLANADADTNRCQSNYPKSKIGEVFVNTPLLPNLPSKDYAVEGAMYLEQQGPTAASRLKFVLYLAMPGGQQIVRGGARIAGSTDGPTAGLGSTSETTSDLSVIDGTALSPGQLEADFNGLPDVTYTWMRLDFQGGRAPDNHIVGMFVTPQTCQVNSTRVRVNSNNNNATTTPATAPNANKFFNTPGDPNLSFTTTGCPGGGDAFTPQAQIAVTPNAHQAIATEAAGHPDMTATITRADLQKDLKKTTFHLPAGMTGAPTATPTKCSLASATAGSCPANTAVGSVKVRLGSGSDYVEVTNGKIYNTQPANSDEPARLTTIATIALGPFDLGRMSLPITTSFRPSDMGLDATVELPQRFEGIKTHYLKLDMILWGWADQGTPQLDDDKPFLTNPSRCPADGNTIVLDAWAADGSPAVNPVAQRSATFFTTGCPMEFPVGTLPTLEVNPTSTDSESPTGLNIKMTNGTAASFNPTVGKIKIEFPHGMTVNPAVGNDGVNATCSSALIDAGGTGCPAASRRGAVSVKTPLLTDTFTGYVYLEQQGATKETRFRLAMVVDLPGTKLVIRGRTEIDGASDLSGPTGAVNTGTGVITAVFDDIYDLPFYEMNMNLYSGNRALLVNPSTCGSAVMKGEIEPNSNIPDSSDPADLKTVKTYSSYDVTGCQTTPPTPTFSATLSPGRGGDTMADATNSAGHPNFNLTVGNLGKSPQLSEFDLDLPSGFVADTVKTPRCNEQDAIAGNCPANTEVGTVNTVMGSPTETLTLPGKLYNFQTTNANEPARLGAIVDIVVGPFNLKKLSIPVTTQLRSDYGITTHTELPYRYEGIDVFIRQLSLTVKGYTQDAGGSQVPFMINPTECGNHTINARIVRRSGPPVNPIGQSITINGCPRSWTDIAPAQAGGLGLKVTPATTETAVPTAMTFEVSNSINNPTIEKIVMDMPVGMELNPAVGKNLVTCPSAEINNNGGAGCENTTAKVGSVTLNTPLLPTAQTGSVFLENPIGNDKDTRYRIAIVAHLPGKDLIARGKVTIDGSSTIATGGTGQADVGNGRMHTEFFGEAPGQSLPDLAFSKMTVNFNGGPQGKPMFVNSRTCGAQNITGVVTPHGDGPDQNISDSYTTTSDCGASAFTPTFNGSSSPSTSAANPTLTMTATVPNKNTNIKQFDIDLPTGLVAATGNVPLCSLSASEQGNCLASSAVGDVSATIGYSNTLADDYTIPGKIYNVQPQPGEPARLAAGIDVVVGPFNLGKMTLPITAQLRPDWGVTTHTTLPQRYEGIAVAMRSMTIVLAPTVGGKPFAINPSKCKNNVITAHMTSNNAQTADSSWNFNTTGCAAFNPSTKPTIAVQPSTTQAGAPVGLRIDVNSTEGNPTIKRTQFQFPQGMEINAGFAKDLVACPTATIDSIDSTGSGSCTGTKIADVTLTTPMMSSRPQGKMYIETPGVTGATRYRTALILDLPGRKLVVRGAINIDGTTDLPGGMGSTDPDATGQLTADFDNIPDLGFTQLRLDFNAGSKAMMINPTTCDNPHVFTGTFTPNSVATTASSTTSYSTTACGASFAPTFSVVTDDHKAAGHPNLSLRFKNAANQQELRELKIKLPQGLVANTTATGTRCSAADAAIDNCLPSHQIGVFKTWIGSTDETDDGMGGTVDDRVSLTSGKIYNVVPPNNEPARLQAVMPVAVGPFNLGKLSIPVSTKLNPDMSVDAITTIPARFEGIAVKLREMHMDLSGQVNGNNFMINPSKCGPASIVTEMTSDKGVKHTVDSPINGAAGITDCPVTPAYNPTVTVGTSPSTAGAPTNLSLRVQLPDSGSTTSNVKMVFPEGFEISPGAGDGLVACETIDSDSGASCASTTSRLASVTLTTPLLPGVQTGDLFLEAPIGREAATRFRIAMVVHLPGQDLVIHGGTILDGSSDLIQNKGSRDTGTGQITATFPGLPDLGFNDLQVNFNGAKKLFVNPLTCAAPHTVSTELTPHDGSGTVTRSPQFSTTGGTCGATTFQPTISGSLTEPGTNDPAVSGGNPDLNVNISNADGMHELTKFELDLPEGLVARTTGVPQCEILDAEAGNCLPASTVGTVTTTIGSFGETLDVTGDIVNVVPAADQPARLYAVVPVQVGPFDMGNLVVDVPTKLNDDLTVTAKTELPARYEGIAVRIRNIELTVKGVPSPGQNFMVAPSKCGIATINARFHSNRGADATGSFDANVVGCPRNFVTQPQMTVSASPAVRNTPVNLTFDLASNPDNPTIKSMHVDLPDNVEINPAFGNSVGVCATNLVDAGGAGCPANSRIGVVTLRTQLLDPNKDWFGDVYLEPQGNTAATRFRIAVVVHLPGADLVVRGRVSVAGSTDLVGGKGSTTDSGTGKITADFDDIPDLGFTKLKVAFNTTRPMLINAPVDGAQQVGMDIAPHSSGSHAIYNTSYTTTGGNAPAVFNPTFTAAVNNTTAAGHPDLTLTVDRLNNNSESMKQFNLELPTGLVAAPASVPACTEAAADAGTCAAASKVGTFTTRFGNGNTATEDLSLGGDIYNVEARTQSGKKTEPARLSAFLNVLVGPFDLGKLTIPITTELRADTGINTQTTLPTRYEGIAVRIKQMRIVLAGNVGGEPFMQNASKCQNNPIKATITSASGNSTVTKTSSYTTTGCPMDFGVDPDVTVASSSGDSSAPTALNVSVSSDRDNPTIGKIEMKMPEGMSVNAAVGNGLVTCPTSQLNSNPDGCPVASRQGTVSVDSPLIDGTFTGYVYLEDPLGNDADTRYRLAIAIELPGRTIVVRGKVTIDGSTTIPSGGTGSVDQGDGRITATFDAVPDLSFSNFDINFATGPRALMTNPDTCGSHAVEATIWPSSGGAPATKSPTFDVTDCAAASNFNPSFSATADSTLSGANTDLHMTVDAGGRDEQLRSFVANLPAGLVADTTASAHCSQADAAAAICGAGSRVGSVTTKLGSGSETLDITTGEIHNVTANSDEPARLAAIVPVLVGPYDLGKLSIPVTTKLRADDYGVDASTQIPLYYEGVRVRIQQMKMDILGLVGVNPNEKGFIKNPSRCGPGTGTMQATIKSAANSTVVRSVDYPITGCPRGFVSNPTMTVSGLSDEVEAPTGMTMEISSAADNPTIGKVSTAMPDGMTLNPAVGNRIDACSTADLNAGADNCPAESIIGTVEMVTPLLAGTHYGKVYLEAQGATKDDRYKLAIVIDLPGTNVVVHGVAKVDGSTNITPTNPTGSTDPDVTGNVVAEFDGVPDLNFSNMKIVFDDGPQALLTNSPTCGTQTMVAQFTPQSGGSTTASNSTWETSFDGEGAPCPVARDFNPTFEGSIADDQAVNPDETHAAGNPDLTLKVTRGDKQQQLKEFNLNLPPGLVADTVAKDADGDITAPRCSVADAAAGACAANTAVGEVSTKIGTGSETLSLDGTLNNVVPVDPDNEPARFAAQFDVQVGPYNLGKLSIPVLAEIVTGASPSDLAIAAKTQIPQRYEGVPVRIREMEIKMNGTVDGRPFMIAPSKCGMHEVTAEMVSGDTPAQTKQGSFEFATSSCPANFNPSIDTAVPTGEAGIPTGFDFSVLVPGNSSSIQAITTKLPEGFEINPGVANRGGSNNSLQACDAATLDGPDPATNCPASSIVGDVTLDTPLLSTTRTGHVYLETPGNTPATRYKLAIVIDLPGPDLIIHGQANVNGTGDDINSGTGQVSATFTNLPDLQFSKMTVSFEAGDHAMLTSPKACGTYESSADLTPWSIEQGQSDADATVTRTDSVTINSDCNADFGPTFSASVADSTQAASSDLTLDVTAGAKDERLSKMTLGLPVGLVANTTAVLACTEASVKAALCNSAVGEITTSVGAGGDPLSLDGEVYNVQPHADEPARLAAAVDVEVGPYDLGRLVIPVSTKIRPGNTGPSQRRYGIDATTDIPTRFEGVAIQVREMHMTMYGHTPSTSKRFIVNPSKCGTHTVTAEFEGQNGANSTASDDITIDNCRNSFVSSPSISVAADPTETMMPTNFSLGLTTAEANQTIGSVTTVMPEGMTINPAFGNGFGLTMSTCAKDDADAGNCPDDAQIGTVSLLTPLLSGTQTGKVYLVAPGNTAATRYRLAIIIDVPGQKLVVGGRVEVDGSTELVNGLGSTNPSATGRMTAIFDEVPDLAFTSMQVNFDTGERSLLTNPETCGTQTVSSTIMPTSGSTASSPVGSYVTSYDGEGAPCLDPEDEPFNPTFDVEFSGPDATKAAGNPDVTITVTRPQDKSQQLKDFDLEMPAGLVANTVATPRCSQALAAQADCAAASRVGDVTTAVGTGGETLNLNGGIYNVETSSNDEPARLAAVLGVQVGPYDLGKLSVPVTAEIIGDTASNLRILTHTTLPTRYEGIPVRMRQMQIKLLGRVGGNPFMINPSRCKLHNISAHMTSTFGEESTATDSFSTDGCGNAPYNPGLEASVTDNRAGKPTGLNLAYTFQDSSSSTKKIFTKLPPEMNINPGVGSYAQYGEMTCDPADIEAGGSACPEASRVGTVKLDTPLLPTQRTGYVYLETPGNTAAERYRIGVYVDLPGSSLVVHGRTRVLGSTDLVDGMGSTDTTGETGVIAEFDELPDLQFSRMEINFKTSNNPSSPSGTHALLTNPERCGGHSVTAQMWPWSRENEPNFKVEQTASFNVSNCAVGDNTKPVTEGPMTLTADTKSNAVTVRPNGKGVGEHADLEIDLQRPDGNRSIQNTTFQLPKGLVGSADATDNLCADNDATLGDCDDSTRVGDVELSIGSSEDRYTMDAGLYNVVAPSDRPAKLSFQTDVNVGPYHLGRVAVPIDVNIDPNEYFLTAKTADMPQRFEGIAVRVSGLKVTMRGMADQGTPSTADDKPFMSNPRSCGNDLKIQGKIKLVGDPTPVSLDSSVGPFVGCEDLNLDDNHISVDNNFPTENAPNNEVPEAPTNLKVRVSQGDQPTQAGLENMSLKLPGFRLNAAAADGANTCTQAQLDAKNCPALSSVGKVWLDTKLLPKNVSDPESQIAGQHSLWGYIYLMKPGNTSTDRYKMAIQMTGKTTINIPGTAIVDEVEGSPTEGEMVTEFKNLPDIPFEAMEVVMTGINDGDVTPLLLNPENSDTANDKLFRGVADMSAHSGQSRSNVDADNQMRVTHGSVKAFTPESEYDLSTFQSGAHPDATFSFLREDGQEDIKSMTMHLPAGFLGSAAAVPQCSIANATAGTCDPASEVGTLNVKTGQFGQYLTLGGKVYLTTGQSGDIAGMAIKVRAQVNDYDLGNFTRLGTVKVRPSDHGIDVTFSNVPKMFKGVPTHLSQMDVTMNGVVGGKPMLFNASSCNPGEFKSDMTSWGTGTATSTPMAYQATGCASRSFSPRMSFVAQGGGVGNPPAWTIKLGSNDGDSTFAGTQVVLPTAITVNTAGLGDACTIADADARNCKDSAKIGTVSIATPLLPAPVAGTVYMAKPKTASGLPDMLIEIPAPIDMQIRGANRFVGTDFNQIQSTFENLPDMIFSEMTMSVAGGPKGLIALRDGGVCGAASTRYTSHSGQTVNGTAPILGIEGYCNGDQAPECLAPQVLAKTKGVKKAKNKKATTTLTLKTFENCKALRSVKVTYPKGSKFNSKLLKYNKKKKATKKNLSNLTAKIGSKSVKADAFKYSKNVLSFKSPFPDGTKSLTISTKNSALVLPYKTFCGHITKAKYKKKYAKTLKSCQAKKVTFRLDVTNADGSTFTYNYSVKAGSKSFR
jgi:hypothetical protein